MRAQWAWALLTLAACSGKSACGAPGTRPAAPAGADEACAVWAAHSCGRLEACAPLSVQVAYGDVGRCMARNRPSCVSALRASGTGDDPAGVEACARAYDTASCDDVVVGRPPEACKRAGARPPGAACGDDAQCAGPHAHCRMGDDEACGTCAALGPADAACDSDKDCAYGLVCYFTCMPPVTLGAACDGMTRQCPQTLVCYDYVCAAPAAVGTPCNPQADACDRDHGLFCDPRTRVCGRYAVADIGAPCGPATICKGGSCETASGPSDGPGLPSICTAHASDGARCDPASGSPCAPPARCIRGACQLPDPAACL
jgi:hypothetical protein